MGSLSQCLTTLSRYMAEVKELTINAQLFPSFYVLVWGKWKFCFGKLASVAHLNKNGMILEKMHQKSTTLYIINSKQNVICSASHGGMTSCTNQYCFHAVMTFVSQRELDSAVLSAITVCNKLHIYNNNLIMRIIAQTLLFISLELLVLIISNRVWLFSLCTHFMGSELVFLIYLQITVPCAQEVFMPVLLAESQISINISFQCPQRGSALN